MRAHDIRPPRVALVHSWLETQNEGWVRYAFDQLGVPYTYISDQSLRPLVASTRSTSSSSRT